MWRPLGIVLVAFAGSVSTPRNGFARVSKRNSNTRAIQRRGLTSASPASESREKRHGGLLRGGRQRRSFRCRRSLRSRSRFLRSHHFRVRFAATAQVPRLALVDGHLALDRSKHQLLLHSRNATSDRQAPLTKETTAALAETAVAARVTAGITGLAATTQAGNWKAVVFTLAGPHFLLNFFVVADDLAADFPAFGLTATATAAAWRSNAGVATGVPAATAGEGRRCHGQTRGQGQDRGDDSHRVSPGICCVLSDAMSH
jgi:hypothetical protein